MRAKLHRASLRLCGGLAAAALRQSHRDAEGLVVLLGGARLGRRAPFARLVRLWATETPRAATRAGRARGERNRVACHQGEATTGAETNSAQAAQQEPEDLALG